MKKTVLSLFSFVLAGVCLISAFGSAMQGVVLAYNEDTFPKFTSQSYVLLDADSFTVLTENNAHEKVQVASICKLMTTLLTLEDIENGKLKLTDELTASAHAASMEGSQAFLDEGNSYKVEELLKSVIVASANDSAVALAEGMEGSEENFAKRMNKRAIELGMNNTVYENATGLETANQHSTAYDSAIVLKECSKYDLYKKFSNIWMDKFVHPSGRETELVNTNRLIKYYEFCKSGKTGYTDSAGYCLASNASKNNFNLVAVVLKCNAAADRFRESMELFNYGFANFENKKVLDVNLPIENNMKLSGAKESRIEIVPEEDFYIVGKRGNDKTVEFKVDLPNRVKAPIKQGEPVGKITVLEKGKVLAEIKLVSSTDIKTLSLGDSVEKVFYNWAI